ncbi:MAG: aminotransferase class I/II-fold pyridoxal phosphate-dependent enzyme, partial [Eubacteriales bacterium]
MQTDKLDFLNFLEKYKNKNAVSFHMPGHKGARFFKKMGYEDFFKDIANVDITEIAGADNLFKPEGIIKNLMEQYKGLYGSKASYLLVNGSSSGIEAAILACV